MRIDTNKFLAEEQKGCTKISQGCKEQLIIDSVVLEQAHKDNRNLYIAYIDYRKLLTQCHTAGLYTYYKYTKQTHR